MHAGPTYRFGDWRLDADQRLLFRNDELIPLAPKLLETLLLLVRNHGRIVEKEEFIAAVWQGAFVEDGSLLRNVSTLRKLLGDGETGSSLIETIPKRGYRFVAPVELVQPGEDAAVGREKESAPNPSSPASWRTVALAVALVLLLVAISYWSWRPPAAPIEAAGALAPRASLAVLPFQNLTGDAAQEYFADGLTEELITQLSQVSPRTLGVIARTSSMTYKGAKKSVEEVGRELGVEYVLEGSVRNDGGRVRISAQLIHVRDQLHLWAQNYDRDLSGVIAMQDDVARAIALRIDAALPAAGKRASVPGTAKAEAHESYLQGRYYWNTRSEEGLRKSLEHFRAALAKDPNYAQAHSGIADAYNLLVDYYFMPGREGLPLSQAAARKALALDESFGPAHASLAFSLFEHDYDWAGADREFKRAIELNPSYAVAHQWYSRFLVTQGRFEEARAAARRTRELDPHSISARINIGHVEYNSRNYPAAIREMQNLLQLQPQNPWAHVYLALSYIEQGRYSEALAASTEAAKMLEGDGPSFLSTYCLAKSGARDAARRNLRVLKAVRKERNIDPTYLAGIHAALGEPAEAMAMLDQAHAERSHVLGRIAVFPWLDPLRSRNDFQALVTKVGLAK